MVEVTGDMFIGFSQVRQTRGRFSRPLPGVYTFHLSGRSRAYRRRALDREADRRPLDAPLLDRLRPVGQARQLVPQRLQLDDALLDRRGLRPRHGAHMPAGSGSSLTQSDNVGDLRQREPKRLARRMKDRRAASRSV